MFLILSAAAAEMPVSWCASSTGDAEGFAAEVQAAWDAWEEAAPCAGIADEPVGDCDTVEADVAFVFGDPDDEVPDGVLVDEVLDGDTRRFVLGDADWYTDAEIAAGECADGWGLDAMLRHLVGVAIDLPYSCEDGQACTEDEAAAVMNWSQGTCDTRTVNDVDLALAMAAYGPVGADDVGTDSSGPVPLEACFELAVDDGYSVDWSFGDGASDVGESVCHTYTEEGVYEVVATWSQGECDGAISPFATVTACEPPHAADGGALIGYSAIDLELYTENHVEVDVPACRPEVVWQVSTLDGEVVDGDDAWEPQFSLPESGTYNVSVVMTGIGGTVTDAFEVTVSEPESDGGGGDSGSDSSGCGCATGGGEVGIAAWMLAVVGVRRR